MSDIFISYKWDDKDKVQKLVEWLESKLDIKVWIDWTGVRSEDMFSEHIEKAIRECKVFIFMYSKAHEEIKDFKIDWPYREISYASQKDKQIMFVELESCVLAGLYQLEFPKRQVRHANNSQEMDELVKDIRRLLDLPDPNKIPPKPENIKNWDVVNWLVKRLRCLKKPFIIIFVLAALISVLFGLYNKLLKRDNTSHFGRELFSCPDDNHPHFIDLGLPSGTNWACCNVDDDHSKQRPTNYGSYYAWGETKGKDYYDWRTYIHWGGEAESCHDLGIDIAGTQYDVAYIKWGCNWRMPTYVEYKELIDNCRQEWVSYDGVKGHKFTGPSGKSIFLPAAGRRSQEGLEHKGRSGLYWTSMQIPGESNRACILGFNSYHVTFYSGYRCDGQSIRPVY